MPFARALNVAGSCLNGFHHQGMSPQRFDTSSTGPLAAGFTTSTGSIGAML